MAPTKTTKKNALSKTKAIQAKRRENTTSKSKTTKAKEKAASTLTSALQAAKKIQCEASGAGGDSTTTSASEEIEKLKGQLLMLSCNVYMETHTLNRQR
jgi:hypothetical protein